MHDALTVYFNGEKFAGLILAGAAMAIIVVALLLSRGGSGVRSLAVTLGLLALVELAIGVGLYLRTSPQVERLEVQIRADEAGFYSAEHARMARVQRNFVIIEYADSRSSSPPRSSRCS
jgi:hypothetical protein